MQGSVVIISHHVKLNRENVIEGMNGGVIADLRIEQQRVLLVRRGGGVVGHGADEAHVGGLQRAEDTLPHQVHRPWELGHCVDVLSAEPQQPRQ